MEYKKLYHKRIIEQAYDKLGYNPPWLYNSEKRNLYSLSSILFGTCSIWRFTEATFLLIVASSIRPASKRPLFLSSWVDRSALLASEKSFKTPKLIIDNYLIINQQKIECECILCKLHHPR